MNVHLISGFVGQDPEIRYTTKGTACTAFSLAETKHWKDPEGNKKEKTIWVDCKAWGKVAEIIAEHVKKGSYLECQGPVEKSTWDKADCSKGYRTETIVEKFKFGPKQKREESDAAVTNIETVPDVPAPSDDDLPF